jgi:hypothetical protein
LGVGSWELTGRTLVMVSLSRFVGVYLENVCIVAVV